MEVISNKFKIAITGMSGFVGLNLKDYLYNDYEILPLSVRYIPNQEFTLDYNAIIHLAGKAHDLKKVSKPSEYYEANYELTKQLFDSFLNSESETFIFMSTVKAVADKTEHILTEESIACPRTHYGIAKRQAEEYILSKRLPAKKRVYILRPSMIHGEGNKGNLNILYQFVSKGFVWPLGAFHNQRSFLSIDNLCFVIKELLNNKSIPAGIYHVADDKPLSTNEVIEILAQTQNRKSNIWSIPTILINTIVKLGDLSHLPFNSERLEKLTENYIVDNKKITKAIGKKLPISSVDGLIKTFKSFRKIK